MKLWKLMLLVPGAAIALPTVAKADIWIVPEQWRLEKPGPLTIQLWDDDQPNPEWALGKVRSIIVADDLGLRTLAVPATGLSSMTIPMRAGGGATLGICLSPMRLEYSADQFNAILATTHHETAQQRAQAGEQDKAVIVDVVRCTKAIVRVGPNSSNAALAVLGQPLEMIARNDPFNAPIDGQLIKVTFGTRFGGHPIGNLPTSAAPLFGTPPRAMVPTQRPAGPQGEFPFSFYSTTSVGIEGGALVTASRFVREEAGSPVRYTYYAASIAVRP